MKRIHDILLNGAPDAVAIVDHDGTAFTYGALQAMISDAAAGLTRHGVRGGDRVLVLAENSVTFLVAVMALSRLDAWTVLVNARLTAAEVDRLIDLSEARCTVFTPEASPASAAHARRMGATQVATLDCGAFLLSPPRDVPIEPVQAGSDQTAVLIYTSGTVGEPKGVMLTHGNLCFMSQVSGDMRRITPQDVTLAVVPGTHIFGLTSVFLAALAKGSGLIAMPRFEVAPVLDAIRSGVTILPAVPQIFAALMAELGHDSARIAPNKLRFIYAGGAPLDLSLKHEVEALFGQPLHNGYGLTEASPSVAATRLDYVRDDSSIGLPVPGVEVRIHAPDDQGVGELQLRGPNVMKGYFRNPKATAQAMTADGFLRSGDLARQDADGALHIAGRSKELIIRSGFNVYPPEVEAVLTAHPAVTLSAVVGRKVDRNEEVLAFVVARAPVTEKELRAWVRDRMAAYKVPSRIGIVAALPQAATGKIQKNKLLTDPAYALD
ncbi:MULTISPECIES: AMP-binding protein [unclassified Ruegeria]|uniref:class I adenylate-forming enzyme family protein n=1 Tax=unclassified Ruegeria TaxID=2625375 RepID=UPI001ADB899C|nr:AMP-binding protein [Ruegeria sp. R8_1]MBO9417255.1 AMP-binding protein [Ruegeria sp. R8_2]